MDGPIPSARDINIHDSLDERVAAEHFLGLDRQQAGALFRDNFLYYQEDLLFMGPPAFCYYVTAAADYLLDSRSGAELHDVETFCWILEHRFASEWEQISPARQVLRECLTAIVAQLGRYVAESTDIEPGVIAARYEKLLARLAREAGTPPAEH